MHYRIVSILKLNLKIDVVGLILDGAYPTDWETDTLHGASRNALFDALNALDLGVAKESDDLIFSNDAYIIEESTGYVKRKEIIVYKNLKGVKVEWKFQTDNPPLMVTTRLYVNGVAVGSEHTDSTGSYQTVSDNISDIVYGDKIQIYAKKVGASGYEIKDMRIKYMEFESNDP